MSSHNESREEDLQGFFYKNTNQGVHYYDLIISQRLHLGEGNGTPLQYSCLENPMDGEAW